MQVNYIYISTHCINEYLLRSRSKVLNGLSIVINNLYNSTTDIVKIQLSFNSKTKSSLIRNFNMESELHICVFFCSHSGPFNHKDGCSPIIWNVPTSHIWTLQYCNEDSKRLAIIQFENKIEPYPKF